MSNITKSVKNAMDYSDRKSASNSLNKSVAKRSALSDFKYWQNKTSIDLEKSVEVSKRLDEYVDYIEDKSLTPSYEGLAMALKISTTRLNQIETHMTAGIETSEVISRYKSMIGLMDYQLALDGVLSPTIYELRSGHYQGITRKTDVNITPVVPVKQATPEELEQMIKDNKAKKMIIDTE